MTSDKDMKNNYLAALGDARAELAGIQDRRRTLEATVAALSKLVEEDEQLPLMTGGTQEDSAPKTIPVPSGFFQSKTPTEAYRDIQKLWPGSYTGVQIRDAFVAGGIRGKSNHALLAQVHSVLRRARKAEQKAGSSAARNGNH